MDKQDSVWLTTSTRLTSEPTPHRSTAVSPAECLQAIDLRSRSASDTLIRRLDDESFDMFHGGAS